MVLQQRIGIIEQLQRNRTGGQELLDALANTVSRTDTLWLTSLDRKGDALTVTGMAGSINAVANFITELKHSGYFDQVEIKQSAQDDKDPTVQTFNFTLTAQFALPQAGNDRNRRAGSLQPAHLGSGATGQTGAVGEGLGGAMDISFKESPWYIQALIFVALAILLLAAGEYVPGSPVASARNQLQLLHQQDTSSIKKSAACRSTSGATPNLRKK